MSGPRTAKGQARRDALVRAAAELAVEQGLGAVSHRAVAARSGLPLAATTYYFADRADLLRAAAERAWAEEVRRAERAAAQPPSRPGRQTDPVTDLAAHLVEVVLGADWVGDPARLAGYYQRWLEAVRTPGIAELLDGMQQGLLAAVATVLDAHGARLRPRTVLALVDGVAVQVLAERTADGERLVRALAAAVDEVLSPPAPGR